MTKKTLILFFCLLTSACFAQNQMLSVKINGKWGIIDDNGKQVIPAIYQFIGKFNENNIAIAQKNDRIGLIDKKGKTIIPFRYTNLKFLGDSLLAVFDGKWGIKNIENNTILASNFDEIEVLKKVIRNNERPYFIIIKKDKKWGAVSLSGKILYEVKYDSLALFRQNYVLAFANNGKKGLMQLNGKKVLKPVYDKIEYDEEKNLILIEKDKLKGLVNRNDDLIIPPKFGNLKLVKHYGKEYIETWKNNLVGLYDMEGYAFLKAEFQAILPQQNRTFLVKKHFKTGLYSAKGVLLLALEYDDIQASSERYFALIKNQKVGLYSLTKKRIIIPVQHKNVKVYNVSGNNDNDFFLVEDKDKEHLVDVNGKTVIRSGDYQDIRFDRAGVFAIKSNDKWGVTNSSMYIRPQFDRISLFNKNIALVINHDQTYNISKFGIINIHGQILAPAIYQKITIRGKTARLFTANNQIKYLTFDNLGRLVDQFKVNKFRTLSIKKVNQVKEETEWDFDFDQNQVQARPRPFFRVQQNTTQLSKSNNAPEQNVGKFTWKQSGIYENERQQKLTGWQLYEKTTDTLRLGKIVFASIYVDSLLKLTAVSYTRVGYQEGKKRIGIFKTLVDNQTGFFLLKSNRFIQPLDMLEDFKKGKLARVNSYYIDKTGKTYGKVKMKIKEKEEEIPFFYVGRFNQLNFARFNIFGVPASSRLRFINKGEEVKKGKWGLIDRNGNILLKPTYDFIEKTDSTGFTKVYNFKNRKYDIRKYGMLDVMGKEIIKPEFEDVEYLKNTDSKYFLLVKKQMTYGFIDTNANVITDIKYKSIRPFHQSLAAVQNFENKWTFVNTKGEEIQAFNFTKVRDFSNDLAAVEQDKKWGFINKKGQLVIKNKYNIIGDFHDERAWVMKKGKFGFIDKNNKLIIKRKFRKVKDFQNGLARVMDAKKKEKNKWGLINQKGNWIVKPIYFKIEDFNEQGYALVRKTHRHLLFGLINTKGEIVVPTHYKEISKFKDGLAIAKKGEKSQVIINDKGREISKTYIKVLPFSEGLALVKSSRGWGYINKEGREIISPQYQNGTSFYKGLAKIMENNKNYYLNKKGEKVRLPKTLDWRNVDEIAKIGKFQEGLAPFEKNGKWGFINYKKEVIIPARYKSVTPFYRGLAKVEALRASFYINKIGIIYRKFPNNKTWINLDKPYFQITKEKHLFGVENQYGFTITNPKYESLGEFKEGFAPVAVKSFKGIADLNGQVIIEPIYENIDYVGNGIFRVEKNGEIGYWHKRKTWIWQLNN